MVEVSSCSDDHGSSAKLEQAGHSLDGTCGGGSGPTLGTVRIGTAGFTCAHWAGQFYPISAKRSTQDMLNCYQEKLDTVEINSTHYGTPSASTVHSWRSQSAKGFEMVWKVVKTVTHEGRMDRSAALDALRHFLSRAAELGQDVLPILLFQCPRHLRVDVAQVEAVQGVIEAAGMKCRVALELRHEACFADEKLLASLKQRRWALVVHPDSVGRATVGNQGGGREGYSASYQSLEPLRIDIVTTDFVYVRLHGDNDEHTYRYSDEELRMYATQLHAWRSQGLNVYCFILNDDSRAAMPQNAVKLRELVHSLAGEDLPRPLKQASTKSIMSYFNKAKAPPVAQKANLKAPGDAVQSITPDSNQKHARQPIGCTAEASEPHGKKIRID